METTAKSLGPFGQLRMSLADIFASTRHQELERELGETRTRLQFQKKRTERLQQRYDALDKQCVALEKTTDALRSHLRVETQRTNTLKEVVQTLCTSAGFAEKPKQLYETVSPLLDCDGFQLFWAAEDITGFRTYEQFPYEDNCGCFEFADGFELMRYLEASEFGAVEWEVVPGTTYEKATLREVDKSTQAYQEFERQLYSRVLERMGLQTGQPEIEQTKSTLAQDQQL